jgi:hypothetical protein
MVLALALAHGCQLASPQVLPPQRARPPAASRSRPPEGPPDRVVDCNGGSDDTTISAAIAAAPDRGWIEVRPCTYPERLDFRGKTLWIQSTDGPAATIIDAGGAGPAVSATRGEGDRTALVGFTLDDGEGEAVKVDLSALRLQDVVITNTDGSYVIEARSADLELSDVTIDASNQASWFVLTADKGTTSIRGATVACGTGEGLDLGHGGFLVDGVVVDCPAGNDDAIQIEHAVGRVQRSRLVGDVEVLTEDDHLEDLISLENTVVDGDIDVEYGTFALQNAVVTGQVSLTDVADTVRIENSVFTGAACAIGTNVPLGPVRYNDFAGGAARCDGTVTVGIDGNVAVDPMFVATGAGDLHLAAGSPLTDAGNPDPAYRDVDGTRNDIGVHGGRFDLDGGW